MSVYGINLIRDRVLPPRYRRALYGGMLVYLPVCGLVLAFTAYNAAKQISSLSMQRHAMRAAECQVLVGSPAPGAIAARAEELRPQLADNAEILAGIETSLKQNIDFVSILLGIVKPLPAGCLLLSAELQPDKQQLRFSIITPADNQGSRTAGELIADWNKAGILQKHIGEIQAETSRREFRNGQTVIVHRFKAALKKG